ncbi:hypothetical protein AAG747_20195 [Rapidithrix thailandica]|uniref:Uncharacterized protein n=1 Tax=Rapidithrix thailandica TaxID=413964 RepID=A0AAW9SHT7_9BACT
MKIEDFDKKNIFKVPDDYFDKLPYKIQQRITTPSPQKAFWQLPLLKLTLPAFALFACIYIGISHFYLNDQPSNSHTVETQWEELLSGLKQEEIQAYLLLNEVSEEEILETYKQHNLSLEHSEFDQLNIEDIIDEAFVEEEIL